MITAIAQGTTCTVLARDCRDGAGVAITSWAGWTAHGVIRAEHYQGQLLATYRSGPGADEHPVVFVPGSGAGPDAVGGAVAVTILPTMSAAWTARRVLVQVEIYGPLGAALQTARIIDKTYPVDPEAVT